MQKSIKQISELYLIDKPNTHIAIEIIFFSASWVCKTLFLHFWSGEEREIEMPISDAVALIKAQLSGKYNTDFEFDFDLMFYFEESKEAQIDFVKAYLSSLCNL